VKERVGIKRCFVVSKFRALLWKDERVNSTDNRVHRIQKRLESH